MGRMGPRTKQSAGQRRFFLLKLIVVILFGVHFESDILLLMRSDGHVLY